MSFEPNNSNDDLGFETFEEVYQAKFQQAPPQQEEGILATTKEVGRHLGRTTARVTETLTGLPGDIREVSKFAGSWLGDKARSILGKDPLTEEQRTYVEERLKPKDWDLLGRLSEALPTSTDVREGVTRKFTGEYLEPQNKYEAFADEVASDFASLALPIKGKIPFARALGTSLIANTGGEVAGAFLGEKGKDYTKLGLLFASGMLGNKKGGIKKYINGLYDDMRSEVPEAAKVSSKELSGKLNKISAQLRKGDPGAATKEEAFNKINAIQKKINGGQISLDEVLELTKDTNESIFGLGDLKRSENQLYKIRDALHDTTKEYGSQNAAFLEKWKDANQAYGATELSRKVGSFVKKNVRPRDYLHAMGALGLEAVAFGAPLALQTLEAGVGAAGVAYSAEVMKRIATSPALRKYYTNVVTNSLKQNKAGLVRAVKQLDDGLKKSFKEEAFETFEVED